MAAQPKHEPQRRKKYLTVGLLAHVDAGKTTLTEALLCAGGALRTPGRVDHGDAFLDNDAQERERGITIFSKQALLPLPDGLLTLLDTPGHVDFSAETERVLSVLDYAVLVISGTDGVQSHTETLWGLLKRRGIPVFLFVNKLDLPTRGREALLRELRERLDSGITDCSADRDAAARTEELASCDEALLEEYFDTGTVSDAGVIRAIQARKLFPCCFGSALRLDGTAEFLALLERYTAQKPYPDAFGAKIYKITRDGQGKRLTWLKVTGGVLRPRMALTNRGTTGANGLPVPEEQVWEEKADQLRLYSGTKFRQAEQVEAGMVCAVTGLSHTFAGQGLGAEPPEDTPVLTPVLNCQVLLPGTVLPHEAAARLRQLEEEDPQLHLVWSEAAQELHLHVMGAVQLEVLQRLIRERFGYAVRFGPGSIVYRETLSAPVEGVGHFEPLRHYAEVHLLLEPGERGSGLVFDTACPTDLLDRNWQRLILTHLAEREHPGVLTGSPITDLKITLLSGRAHEKHTEGGDFREATCRAVRNGLMRGDSVLLEPWYDLRLEVPAEQVGRAMTDVQQAGGTLELTETVGGMARLTGSAPVDGFREYALTLAAYTKGRGRMSCTVSGYRPCHNQAEIVAALGYQAERDTQNPADSVFCGHGAGFIVPWQDVPEYMHLPFAYVPEQPEAAEEPEASAAERAARYRSAGATDRELEAIFTRTYGPVKQRRAFESQRRIRAEEASASKPPRKEAPPQKEYLLVDGYNIIFAWDELKALAKTDLAAARERLQDILCSYQGMRGSTVILVFDAYKVRGGVGSVERFRNISIVYTREAETADMYIEKATLELGKHSRVRVATSDGLEQLIILGHNALRVSARSFREEVAEVEREIQARLAAQNG